MLTSQSHSLLSFGTKATSAHADSSYPSSRATSRPPSPDTRVDVTHVDESKSTIPRQPRSFSLSDAGSTSHASESYGGSTTAAGSSTPSDASVLSLALEDDVNPNEIHEVDVYDKGDYTTTRTIIRPAPRYPPLGLSRPSSPPISRPGSPFGKFSTFNCFNSTDAFEDDLEYFRMQRSRELAGRADVRIVVTQEKSVYTEELWRDAVQQVLYGRQPEDAGRYALQSRAEAS